MSNFMIFFIYILIAIPILYIAIQHVDRLAKQELKQRIGSREIILFTQWYSDYYGKDKAIPAGLVEDVLTNIAKEMGVFITQLRPTDRFDSDLAVKGKYRHFLVDDVIGTAVETLFKKYQIKQKRTVETIDDLIRFIAGSSLAGNG